MEHGPFIDEIPMKKTMIVYSYVAMLVYHMVNTTMFFLSSVKDSVLIPSSIVCQALGKAMDGGVELQTFGRCQKVDEALGWFPGFPNGWRVPWVEKPSNFRDCTGSEPSNIGKYQQGIVFQN